MIDIFLLKLEKDLPKYPYYLIDWKEVKFNDEGDPLNDSFKRFISLNNEIELHFQKKTSTEYLRRFINLDDNTDHNNAIYEDKYTKIDTEYYDFYNIKKRKYSFDKAYFNYYRKDGPARIEKNYNYKKKTTTYYCRWYSNLKGQMCRQYGPANYRVSLNEKNELDIISFEWLRNSKRSIHRNFAPATYSFNKYKWYLNGIEYSSYNYWLKMIEKYPKKYKKIHEDDSKIIIKSKSPSPCILYKKNKNSIWKLNNKTVSMKKYWDHFEKQNQHFFIVE